MLRVIIKYKKKKTPPNNQKITITCRPRHKSRCVPIVLSQNTLSEAYISASDDITLKYDTSKWKMAQSKLMHSSILGLIGQEHMHRNKNSQKIDWDDVKVLEKETRDFPRKVLEAIHVRKKGPNLNRDTGLELDKVWANLLRSLTTQQDQGEEMCMCQTVDCLCHLVYYILCLTSSLCRTSRLDVRSLRILTRVAIKHVYRPFYRFGTI